jgi:hypothetical protein
MPGELFRGRFASTTDEADTATTGLILMEITESLEDYVFCSLLSAFVDDLIFEECINVRPSNAPRNVRLITVRFMSHNR